MFTKRPCLGIRNTSCLLNDDTLRRLKFTDSPVTRYKATDCEEWVEGDGIESRYPAMCIKCREIMAMPATRGKHNLKYESEEEEKIVKVEQELSLTTSELDFVDSNAGKLDSEGDEEDEHLDDSPGIEVKQDEVCEEAFDEYEEEFIPRNVDDEACEVTPEPKVEMWEERGDCVDVRYVILW